MKTCVTRRRGPHPRVGRTALERRTARALPRPQQRVLTQGVPGRPALGHHRAGADECLEAFSTCEVGNNLYNNFRIVTDVILIFRNARRSVKQTMYSQMKEIAESLQYICSGVLLKSSTF